MSVVLADSDHRELFSHLLLYGVGQLCADAGVSDVLLSWTEGATPRPQIAGVDGGELAALVAAHAARHAEEGSWIQLGQPAEPTRGLFSPRLRPPADGAAWADLQLARQRALDVMTEERNDLALRMIAALGEPAYWPVSGRDGDVRPDDGASRLDMQARNQGSEIVGTKLRPLASAVAAREPDVILEGLLGHSLVDDLAGTRTDGRTATNLRQLGPTDSTQAWVALWGLTTAPVAPQVGHPSRTALHVPRKRSDPDVVPRAGAFAVPVWHASWRPARLRAVLASRALAEVAGAVAAGEEPPGDAQDHLQRRGVLGIVVFPVSTGGSASAPERRALGGQLHRFAST